MRCHSLQTNLTKWQLITSLLHSEHIGRLTIQIKTYEERMSHFSLPKCCASSGLQVYFYTYFLVDSMELSSWIVPLERYSNQCDTKDRKWDQLVAYRSEI